MPVCARKRLDVFYKSPRSSLTKTLCTIHHAPPEVFTVFASDHVEYGASQHRSRSSDDRVG